MEEKQIESQVQQRTPEWKLARRGRITASEVYELMKRGRAKEEYFGKTAMKYLLERFTSGAVDEEPDYVSPPMQWGIDHEDKARELYIDQYQQHWGSEHAALEEVGFMTHDGQDHYGCSPDGVIVDYTAEDNTKIIVGCIEIKCPYDSTMHMETLLTGKIPELWFDKHYAQMQMQMFVTGSQWCDYISYDPRMKDRNKRLNVIRIDRDETFITELQQRLLLAKEIFATWSTQLQ